MFKDKFRNWELPVQESTSHGHYEENSFVAQEPNY